MDLETFRKHHGMTYCELVEFLGFGRIGSVRRIALGLAWPGCERLDIIRKRTLGAVTLDAMLDRYLAAQSGEEPERAAEAA